MCSRDPLGVLGGPKGKWRPADPVACVIHVMRIATGEIEETYEPPARRQPSSAARRQASKAAKARAASQTRERRREIAKAAAAGRWGSDFLGLAVERGLCQPPALI